jgi:HAD superfamily hydrolase (TIGR01509 family)
LIKAVLFDYGGTLFQAVKPWEEIMPRALLATYRHLERHGLKMSYEEYLEINMNLFDRYSRLEAAKQRDISDRLKYLDLTGRLFPSAAKNEKLALASGATDSFWRVVNGNYRPRTDVRGCLSELKAMGIKMGVVSNHHDRPSLLKSLRHYRLEPKFDRIVVSEAVKVRKPNPAIFRLCLSAMDVNPSQAIHVGDSAEYDVAGAKATGLSAVLIGAPDEDEPEPDFKVEKLAAIPPIVADLNGKR